jgi:hypothetical protein
LSGGVTQAQPSQVIHHTQTEFSPGIFNQTVLEGTETAPEINLDSYSVFSWTFEDYDISGWSPGTKGTLAVANEDPPGQIHLRAERNSLVNESYALFTRALTVPAKFVIEYRIYFDNLSPSGVSVPGDVLGVDQPTGACARLDVWNPVAGFRMDIFTDRMVSFWTKNSEIKDYPTVSYFDVPTGVAQWYILRLEGDFTDPQLPVQVYRDNVLIGELNGHTGNLTGNSIRPMAYSRTVDQVAEVHIDYVKLGTATPQYYANGTYTSPILDLGATSFGSFSWTDKTTGYPYPWGEWTKYSGNPVVQESPNGNLVENILTDINDPLQQPIRYPHPDTGVNKYWLVNATCCGGDIRISYSEDLLNWTPYEHNPILSPRSGEDYLFSPNIFKKDNLYYLVHDVAISGRQRIAYATAPTPLGPWTGGWTEGQRILDIGASSEWDQGRVTEPFVFRDGDTYYLFYMGDGLSSGNGEQIGLATTTADRFPLGPTGGLWTKHGLILPHNPDPAAWDRGLTADPSVIKVGSTFYMLYTGSYANAAWKLGIAWATSPFGPWNRPSSPNVPLGPAGAWDDDRLVRGAIHYHDGKYYMPYTGNDGSRYRGGMATADPYVPETLIAFHTRTSPNGTDWPAWTPVLNNGDVISSTPARYLQYQATLNLGLGGSSPGLTSVTINYDTNTAPRADDDNVTTDEDTPQDITLSGTDTDGDSLTFMVGSGPEHGSLGTIGAPSCTTSGGISTCTATVTYTPTGDYNGPDSFTFVVNDGTADSDEATVTITVSAVNDPPVATNDDKSTPEDTALSFAASDLVLNDSPGPANESGQSLTVTAVGSPSSQGGTISLNGGDIIYTPAANFNGADSFPYTVCDNGTPSECTAGTVEVTVTAVNDAPTVSVSSTTQTVQYSDGIVPITIEANDIDSSSLSVSLLGLPSGLEPEGANPCTALPCTWTIEGDVTGAAGTYDVTISISDSLDTVSKTTTVVVEPEDADVVFYDDNPVAVLVASPGGSAPAFNLYLDVFEIYPEPKGSPAYPGDIRNAQLQLSLVSVGPGGGAGPITCSQIGVDDPTNYGTRTFQCIIPAGLAVNTYSLKAQVDGGYYTGEGEDVLVVYDPSLGFATGGGWFYWPGTEIGNPSDEDYYPGDKTNFGFTMKYNKKGQNVKGSLLLIRHLSDGTTFDSTLCDGAPIHNTIYRVKSNALYGLALGDTGTYGWASFGGKATYLDPCMETPQGNHEFIVYVEDRNEPGKGIDRFWVQIKDRDGVVIEEMSMPPGAAVPENNEDLQGGNIVVPHR